MEIVNYLYKSHFAGIFTFSRAGQIKIIPKKYRGNLESNSPTIIIYVNF